MLKKTGHISKPTISPLQTRPKAIQMFVKPTLSEYRHSRPPFLFHPSHSYFPPSDSNIGIIKICICRNHFLILYLLCRNGDNGG